MSQDVSSLLLNSQFPNESTFEYRFLIIRLLVHRILFLLADVFFVQQIFLVGGVCSLQLKKILVQLGFF